VSIEWFRDLSIIILCLIVVAAFVFVSILSFLLYRRVKAVLQLTESIAKNANEIITLIKEVIKPILPLLALIQGICGGISSMTNLFKKKDNEGGKTNEQG
jgi:hypothetical protein